MDKHDKKKDIILFRLSGKGLACVLLPLPSCGFIICVVLSIIYNYEESTSTHCHVPNYLPSISAAIGGSTPQRYIWRIFIGLHSAPRFMVAVCYYNYYRSFHVRNNRWLYNLLTVTVSLAHVLENMCLMGLTNVSSTENFTIHKLCFVGFMFFSQIYMLLSVVMYRWAHKEFGMDDKEKKSYKWKFNLTMFNISVFLMALYVYWRHNTYCEPGMYTVFCLCEYSVVSSNIVYNYTPVYDWTGVQFLASWPKRKGTETENLTRDFNDYTIDMDLESKRRVNPQLRENDYVKML